MNHPAVPLQAPTIYNSLMAKFDPQKPFDAAHDKHHRRSIRLKGYDYSQEGAYYVTIVAWRREYLFGEVVNKETPQGGNVRLNKVGKIIEWEWLELPKRLPYVTLGAHMVMPNHFHGILFIHENVGVTRQLQTISCIGTKPWQIITTDCMDGSPLPYTTIYIWNLLPVSFVHYPEINFSQGE